MIDFRRWCEENGMTIEEFRIEIFNCAASLGEMELENKNAVPGDCIKYNAGRVTLFVVMGIENA